MEPFPIFLLVWLATILAAYFAQGRWSVEIAKADLVSPVAVAWLWPLGLLIAAIAAPFALAYFVGYWLAPTDKAAGQ